MSNLLARLGAVCRPIEAWPGPYTADRQPSPFSAGLTSTIELLDRELRHLDARRIVIGLALGEGQIRLDGLPYASARPDHPGVLLAFDGRPGPLRFACDRYRSRDPQPGWHHNLRAIALTLQALRAVERYGATADGQQYRGYAALPAGKHEVGTLTVEAAAKVIAHFATGNAASWRPVLDDPETRAAWVRVALKRTHPDQGGASDDFARVQAARATLARHTGEQES